MKAIISGQCDAAILLDDDQIVLVGPDAESEQAVFHPRHLGRLLDGCMDVQLHQNVTPEEAVRHLQEAQEKEESLQLALIVLDADLSSGVRSEAAQALEELLSENNVSGYLKSVFFAKTMPDSADVTGGLNICRQEDAKHLESLFRTLVEAQEHIREVRVAWKAIPTETFGSHEHRLCFQAVAVRENLFRNLVESRIYGKRVDEFIMSSMLAPSVQALPNYRLVLQQWAALFRTETPARSPSLISTDDTEQLSVQYEKSKPRRLGIDRKKVLAKVDRQKEAILSAMQNRKFKRVRKYTAKLVEYQVKNGGAEFACKSLCDLAMEAKRMGMAQIHLEFTVQSITLKPDDGWAWAQHADALLNAGKFDQALKAYDNAGCFGQIAIAKSGRADVLKTMGRLDDALQVYDAVIQEHPGEVVAKNGRADVLKTMGRLDDALQAYEVVIQEHPGEVVAKTARADVLKTMGRLDEALQAYDAVIQEHPGDVFAKAGRADVLKTVGRLDDALQAYDAAIQEHPGEVVPKAGRADVLKTMGRLDDALQAYDAVIQEHPSEVVAKNGRADVLKTMGRLDEALQAYEAVIQEHPGEVVPKAGRADVLRTMGRLDDALHAYEAVIQEHPGEVVAKTCLACVLAAKNQLDDALAMLGEQPLTAHRDWVAYHVRGMILMRMGKLTDAIQIFEDGARANPFPASRDYFLTGLAIARLRREDYVGAEASLAEIKTVVMQVPTKILTVHAAGELQQWNQAKEAYSALPMAPGPVVKNLLEELRRRYILRESGLHDDHWVFEREVELLLLAA